MNQDYETRVRAIEAQGATRSDAQAVVDAELLRPKVWRHNVTGITEPIDCDFTYKTRWCWELVDNDRAAP